VYYCVRDKVRSVHCDPRHKPPSRDTQDHHGVLSTHGAQAQPQVRYRRELRTGLHVC
jgi:hypothetical protein